MGREEILDKITSVFKDILDEGDVALTEKSTADDVEGWDSLTHVELVAAVEKQFKIRFTAKEIQSWKNIGEMTDSISLKLT